MIHQPADLTPIADAPAAETPEQRSVRQARELKELAAVGMWLVHDLQVQAQKPAGERPTHETMALAFDRYARAVRLTHMLENRLFAEAEARARFAPPPLRPVTIAQRRRGVLTQLTDEMIEAQDRKDRRFDAGEARERAERLIEEELRTRTSRAARSWRWWPWSARRSASPPTGRCGTPAAGRPKPTA